MSVDLQDTNDAQQEKYMSNHETTSRLKVEDHGAVLIVRVDGGPHALFGLAIADQLG